MKKVRLKRRWRESVLELAACTITQMLDRDGRIVVILRGTRNLEKEVKGGKRLRLRSEK